MDDERRILRADLRRIASPRRDLAIRGVEARIGAAEVVIAALPESASISQSVEAARTLAGELDDLTEASIADRWAQFEGDRAVTVAQAQATSDLR